MLGVLVVVCGLWYTWAPAISRYMLRASTVMPKQHDSRIKPTGLFSFLF
jgi:uncharacterized protein YjeT (DUF2065 family)